MAKVILRSLFFILFFLSSFQIISAQTTNSSQLDYESAIRLLNKDANAEALEQFDQLVSSGFMDKGLYKYRGISKFRLGDFTGAAEDLDKVRKSDDRLVDGLLGICKYELHEWDASKYFLIKAISAGYSDGKAHLYLGYLYFDGHQYVEAVSQLTKAEKAGEKETRLYETRGIAAYYSGDSDLAIKDLAQIVKSEKSSLLVYEIIGLAYAKQDEINAGIPFLKKADSLASKNNEVYFYLGKGLQENKNYNQAIAAYSKAIEFNYASPEVYINRGNCKIKSGLIKESLPDFDFAIKLNPENTMAYRGRVAANLFLKEWARIITDLAIANALGSIETTDWGVLSEAKYALKNYQGALDEVNNALAKGVTHYSINEEKYSFDWQKGRCLVAMKKFDLALQSLNQVQENESTALLFLERAHAYVGLSQFEKAIDELEEAQIKYPKNSTVFYNSAVIKEEVGDFGAAVLDYNKAIAINPTDATAYYGRANSKARKGDTMEAIKDLDKAIDLDNTNATYYKVRANFHYQTKNKDKACFDWRKAVEFGDQKARFSIDQYCNKK
ncbi:MAG: tetratricopeptide repeat protein [Cyclobacteriaceae bacterium]